MAIRSLRRRTLAVAALLALALNVAAAEVDLPGTVTLPSPHNFKTLLERTKSAIEAQKMGLVAQASASAGAAARGVPIAGNAVLMVFRNDYAVRMLQASVSAGVEAPLRLYLTEDADGTASLRYRTPSSVFAPYHNMQIDALALELDPVFERIAHAAVAR